MRLNDWQRELEAYLLGAQPTPGVALRDSLLGSPALSAEEGLAIYHNAYRARLLDALRDDYSALHHWLGDDEFEGLASAYLQAHPSRHFSLRWLGARLADFIDGYLVAAQSAPLAELAGLEWAFTLAFDAADGEPLTLEAMATLTPAEWPELRVRLLPSVQWLPCSYNSLALWRATKAADELPARTQLEQPQVCLIWRQGLVSRYRSLGPAEAQALHGMSVAGWNFGELCAELAAYGDAAPLQAATWLKQWISEGTLERSNPSL
ncbi:DNA-binding domain-containing protein [Pseudomonas sp. LS1212]|uniref:HvfC/BufC N-terminal domain-containing protein n=1 Tax=Pseudomonas sp. LS1212 TaxID=2972478 RepID=UPI00215B9E53|nr:DNA-binding domain-containing protein [Pseudomonas sp. LS1212]UVJ41967.1 DNA-binding domain-containing protein [Pseudomonas sp. LS1212]